jgi:hypothetical protein
MATFPGLVFGPTAKGQRSRRGCERDWNRYGEPARKFMQHGDSMKKSRRWVKYKQNRRLPIA